MPVRFKLDENLPRAAQSVLVDAGHDAHSVTDEGLGGGPDSGVLEACTREDRILVTLDLDFADYGSTRRRVIAASGSFAQ